MPLYFTIGAVENPLGVHSRETILYLFDKIQMRIHLSEIFCFHFVCWWCKSEICLSLSLSFCKSLFVHILASIADGANEKYKRNSMEFHIHRMFVHSLFSKNYFIFPIFTCILHMNPIQSTYFVSEYSCVCRERMIIIQFNSKYSPFEKTLKEEKNISQTEYNIEMNKMDANRSYICKYLLSLRFSSRK